MTEQAAQIQNLIIQGYDAIVINSASPDALERFGAAGVRRRQSPWFPSTASSPAPCAWRIAVDFKAMGKTEVTYLAKKMPKGGNLLEIRGLAGVFVDDAISSGIHEGVKENPQFKIVGAVHGDWAQGRDAEGRRGHPAVAAEDRRRRHPRAVTATAPPLAFKAGRVVRPR